MAKNEREAVEKIEKTLLDQIAVARVTLKGLGGVEIGSVAAYKNGVVIFEDYRQGITKATSLIKLWSDWLILDHGAKKENT